jgi:neutral ceramidase
MTGFKVGAVSFVAIVVGSACVSIEETRLPEPVSPGAVTAPAGLRAGFGVRDITPPPGVGLNSFSADSRQAVGFRQRLHARAIVLEDASGERLALVVAELGQVSVLLQRRVADRVLRSGTGIGADRLVLSATHTHSGPGNFFAADGLNANAGRFAGFDPVVADFVIDGIAGAIEDAAGDLRPAKAGWRVEPVWDFSFNRSFEAWQRNTAPRVPVTPGTSRPVEQQAVDSTFALLRVDRCRDAWEDCEPWGAYGVFPIHGNNIPASNDLFDSDVHGVVARTVERHIGAERGSPVGPAYFLFAQGAEGDVGANLRDPVPCRYYRFLPERRAAGPRTLAPPEAWRAPIDEVEGCLDAVRLEADSLARDLGTRVTEIFDRAASVTSSAISLSRAFTTVDLRTYQGPYPICWPPRVGAAAVGGAEKGFIRTWKHRVLFFDMNFKEGGSSARATPSGCFGKKKVQLGVLVKEYSLPQVMQLGVFEIGEVLLGTVPVEPTTEVGALIRENLLREGPADADRALLVAVTNGYAMYVASADEYEAQHYEGGSTIYGPNTAEMLSYELGRLSASIRTGSPTVSVDSAMAYSRDAVSHFWPARPIPPGFEREVVDLRCAGGEVMARWTDLRPGTLAPAEAEIVELEVERDGKWELHSVDDDPEIQVRAIEARNEGYLWEVRWVPRSVPTGGYRFRMLARQGLGELVSPGCTVR